MADIKIIDLFSGPGGLGEGFSAFEDEKGNRPFSIIASVEAEESAHKTLQLRAFFRKFPKGKVPEEYYQYVRGDIKREELFATYPNEAKAAIEETLEIPRTLGKDNAYIEREIKKRLKGYTGKKVVIGGPPCQAYSLVGRARNMGKTDYVAKDDHRHFLYKEYLNILNIVEPDVFVMENVKGILSATIDDEKIFPKILEDLKYPGRALGKRGKSKYKIYSLVKPANDPLNPNYENLSDFVIKAEQYGIPQARHRVILLGIKEDNTTIPSILQTTKQVNIEDVIGDLPPLRSGLSKGGDDAEKWNSVASEIFREMPLQLKNSGHTKLAKRIKALQANKLKNLQRGSIFCASEITTEMSAPKELKAWYKDDNIKGVLNYETRGHIVTDLARYLFCAAFAEENSDRENPNPKAQEFPEFLAPNHKNWESGKFADRFRVQAKGKYATTITSHISKDGHYFIHYDPLQCRSLTVREAARIQTFPDNYFFEGNRTQQYVQVGNAVPPFLAQQIGKVVIKLVNQNG